MARWDEILSLPVQSPPTLEFSSADLVWSKVEGWRDNIDRVALIPFARVDDFVRGESSNKECPTRFHVEARRRRPLEMSYKPKVDGILEYILYWCSFGPDDHRKGGIVRPSRSTYVPKKKSAGRPNTKRGCTCHFIVKRLIAEPSVALIIYNLDKHVDKKGLPCHGPQDKKAAGTRAMFAPYISDDLRLRVLSLLYVGVSVETIMQRHNESVERQGGPCNRDDLLTHRYVRRLERSIRRSTYELDADDAVSISMWVESHQSHVFFYEDFSDSDPFTLGIQTEWQLQQMIRFGNRSLVASDSRFGTNKLKYPIHTLLVFDSDNKAIPVAWIITSRFANGDEHKWIRALYNRVHSKDPTWKLGGFIVDDPSADFITIREVFQCSVLICFWRVRHAWLKNLVKKCSETQMRFEVFRQLGQAVYSICKGNGNVDLFENFMEDFVDCSDFLDYFRAVWFPRIEMWITALKTLPLSSQETCAAIECYHHQLKLRLLNEKDPSVYQRADWLVDKLGAKVHSYFWLDEYAGKDDFARYQKEEWMSGLTSWRRALEIRDSDVVLEGRCAKVISQRDRQKAHVVWNPGSEFAICDCNWSAMGNLCKHVIKVSRVCRDKGSAIPSISLSEYYLTLINMLHCPPHDSLFRDHAVSLAVCVQMQLNALVDSERNQTTMDPIEKQIISESSANKDRDAVNESQHNVENILTSNKNVSEVVDEAQGSVAGDLGGKKVIDQVGDKNDVCGESVEQIIAFGEMDVDPLSICTSPSAGNNLDGVSFTYGFSENGGSGLPDAGLDMCEDLSSNDNDLIIRNEVRDNMSDKDSHDKVITVAMMDVLEETIIVGMMDVDPQLIKTPMSTLGAAEQHTMTNDNVGCSIVTGSTVNVNLVDCNPQSVETSPSSSFPIDLKSVNVIESTNGISGIGGMKNESQSMCQNLPPSGDADGVTANEFCECDLIDRLESANGVCGHVSEGTGSVMEVLPRSTNASPSMSTSVELQQLVEFVVNETGVCDSVSERASGNMMNISSQSICISASNLEVKQQTIRQVVSTNDMSENGGDLANDNQDISENLFSTANPSIISCEFHDSITHGNCSSEVISQLASDDGVCGDDAEGTISVQAIGNCSNEAISQLASDNGVCGDDAEGTSSGLAVHVSPSEKRSSKLPITIDLVTCDVICCSVAEEFVTGNTMDVDAISRQTSPSELEDVGR